MQRVRTTFGVVRGLAAFVAIGLAATVTLAAGAVVIEDGPVAFLGVSTSRTDAGLRVTQVIRGTAAEAAGVRRGDVIVAFDRQAVATSAELRDLVRQRAAGDVVDLEILRDGDREYLEAELGERRRGPRLQLEGEYWVWSPHMRGRVQGEIGIDRHHDTRLEDIYLCPADENCAFSLEPIWYRADCVGRGCDTFTVRYYDRPMLGVEIIGTTPELNRHFGADDGGVLVGKVMAGSPADEGGVEVGDLIVAVDGETVRDVGDLRRAIRDATGDPLDLEVLRNERRLRITVTIEAPGRSGPQR